METREFAVEQLRLIDDAMGVRQARLLAETATERLKTRPSHPTPQFDGHEEEYSSAIKDVPIVDEKQLYRESVNGPLELHLHDKFPTLQRDPFKDDSLAASLPCLSTLCAYHSKWNTPSAVDVIPCKTPSHAHLGTNFATY